jgi:hypothetical protein
MKERASRFLAVSLSAALALLVVRTLPLLANRDDFIRLYFGGWVGAVTLSGSPEAPRLAEALAARARVFGDAYTASRFIAAQTPYSPWTIVLAGVADAVRVRILEAGLPAWALGVQTTSWLAVLGGAAILAWRVLPAGALACFAAAGLTLAWLHVHTNPLIPAPRGLATLALGVALALVITGRSEAWAHGSVLLAAIAHPYNQALNLCVVLPAALLLAGTPATAGGRPRTALRVAATAVCAVVLALAVVQAANPRGGVPIGAMLTHGASATPANWSENQPAVLRLCVSLLPVLAVLGWGYARTGRALAIVGLFVASVAAPALLWPGGAYPGEISNRVGGAWTALLFALCLRGDLAHAFARLTPRWSQTAALVLAASGVAGAVPEAVGIRDAPHYAPWLRIPRVESRPGVERECLSLIREWTAR